MKKLWLMLFLLAALLTAGLLFLRDAAMFYHGRMDQQCVGIECRKGVEHHDDIAEGIALCVLVSVYFGACLPPVGRGVQHSRQRARVRVDANAVPALRFGVKFLNDIWFVECMQKLACWVSRLPVFACYVCRQFKQGCIVSRLFFVKSPIGRQQALQFRQRSIGTYGKLQPSNSKMQSISAFHVS